MTEFYNVIRICKDDLYVLGYTDQEIEQLDLEHLAPKIGSALMDHMWEALRTYIDYELSKERYCGRL